MHQYVPGGAGLYQRIAEKIRTNIFNGVYRPGDRIPTIRDLSQEWNCTTSTIQHAFKELTQQGLIVSQAGKGTHVVDRLDYDEIQVHAPFRKARLIHRAESFLLESFIAGYSYEEIIESIDLARRHMQTC